MRQIIGPLLIIISLFMPPGCNSVKTSSDDVYSYALTRKSDLRLSAYITAHTVERMFTTEAGRREIVSLLRCNGFTTPYVEVYRSGLARITWPLPEKKVSTSRVYYDGDLKELKFPLEINYQIIPDGASILLQTDAEGNAPFLSQNRENNIFVLNTYTFSQEDFDAVGEVLLCPKQIGLLELPKPWVNIIRSAFYSGEEPVLDAASRVTFQYLSDGSFVIHNYNREKTKVNIQLTKTGDFIDGFTGKEITFDNENEINLLMEPRSRLWFVLK